MILSLATLIEAHLWLVDSVQSRAHQTGFLLLQVTHVIRTVSNPIAYYNVFLDYGKLICVFSRQMLIFLSHSFIMLKIQFWFYGYFCMEVDTGFCVQFNS